MQSARIFFGVFLAMALLVLSLNAQNQVDLSFNAAPSLAMDYLTNTKGQVVQADGKVIVWGGSLSEANLIKGLVVRLNANGSTDTSFSFCGCSFGTVTNVTVLSDGKILVAGSNSFNRGKVIRINPNGSLDVTYSSPFTGALGSPGNSARIRAIQPDGKALIESIYSFVNGGPPISNYVARYQSNGLIDTSFTQIVLGGNNVVFVPDIVIAPDGKIYLGTTSAFGSQSFTNLKRFNADGTADAGWSPPVFNSPFNFANIQSLDVQADGNILVTGTFNGVNGVPRDRFVRVFPAGNVDLGFSVTGFTSASQIKALPDGKILVAAAVGVGSPTRLYRLNSDGSLDNALAKPVADKSVKAGGKLRDAIETVKTDDAPAQDFAVNGSIPLFNKFVLDPSGNAVFFGLSEPESVQQFYRVAANGAFDAGFDSDLEESGKVSFMLRQGDGKVIILGTFINVNGVSKSSFARLNNDGSLDGTFNPGTGFDIAPSFMTMQPDGKVLAAGTFTSYNGAPVSRLIRINSDGTLDGSFNHHLLNNVNTLTLQADGKILAGGPGVVRLNGDGTVDSSFSPIFGVNASVRSIVIQADGKILVGGSFSGVNGFNRINLVRLNTDASLDQSYDPAVANGPGMTKLLLQPDGKLLACSQSSSTIFMDRLNADGSADTSFSQASFTSEFTPQIYALVLRANGEILVGGNFIRAGAAATANFAWLNSSGRPQPLIFPDGVNGYVRGLALQPDGKLLIAGDFSRIDNTPRPGVARVSLANFRGTPPFDFDGDGRADISVFRQSDSNWYLARSTAGFTSLHWGQAGDRVATADYDGDGKSDIAVYRDGNWWYIKSTTNTFAVVNWGTAADIPMPSDFDGDGKADFVYFRPTTGEWFRLSSTGTISNVLFGQSGDTPLIADFDGDGKADPTIFRNSDGVIWYRGSVDGLFYAHPWGKPGDIPVLGDYDGDGKTDPAVFRGSHWFIINSHDGSFTAVQWGYSDDRPVPADYDGDGRTDIAIYRPSNGMWFISQSNGGPASMQFGLTADQPLPNAFLP